MKYLFVLALILIAVLLLMMVLESMGAIESYKCWAAHDWSPYIRPQCL